MIGPENSATIRNSIKVKADIFEAYVAGVFDAHLLEDGGRSRGQSWDNLEGWLRPLFAPMASRIESGLKDPILAFYERHTPEYVRADRSDKAVVLLAAYCEARGMMLEFANESQAEIVTGKVTVFASSGKIL
jgi:hypothetical protein